MSNGPAAMLARKCHLQGLRPGRLQKLLQPQLFRCEAKHSRGNAAHELLARTVDNAKTLLLIESEDRHINLHHHFLEQGRRFKGADLLLLQPARKRVDFMNKVGETVFTPTAAQPEGKIFFADGGYHVGEGLHGPDYLCMEHGAADCPCKHDE